jgi:hypothetical protein
VLPAAVARLILQWPLCRLGRVHSWCRAQLGRGAAASSLLAPLCLPPLRRRRPDAGGRPLLAPPPAGHVACRAKGVRA